MNEWISCLIILLSPALAHAQSLIWQEGFECANPLNTAPTHAGGSVERTTEFAFAGDLSLKFTTPAQQYRRAAAFKLHPFNVANPMVAEYWFMLPVVEDIIFEVAHEGWRNGDEEHWSSISWVDDVEFAQRGWRYWGASGAWVFFAEGAPLAPDEWHHLRVETNFGSEEYVSVTVDGVRHDLTGTPYQRNVRVANEGFHQAINVWTQTAAPVVAFVDQIRFGYALSLCEASDLNHDGAVGIPDFFVFLDAYQNPECSQ